MTQMNIKRWVFILACVLVVTDLTAQFEQTAKIVSTNRESRAEYGTSVAITDNFAIVGASRETIASGAAYVYSKDGQGTWGFLQRLAADDPNEGAEYGGGVAFSENFLVVAAGRADVAGVQRAGALYVYNYQNNTWEFDSKLVASDMSNDAKMGMNPTSLAAQENTIVAGAPGENAWAGSVYVFTNTGGSWTEAQKIVSPNPQASDVFGIGVALSGDYLVIGANEYDNRKGAAYVYLKNGNGTYEYVQTLTASDASNDAFFGTSVGMDGDQMIVGAYGDNMEQGAAYIFERDAQNNWVEVAKLTGNPSTENTQFGWSTSIQRNYAIVSAPHLFGFEAGEMYFYERESSGDWVEAQIVQGSDTAGEDFYGWSIAMHENQVLVGAPWEDHDANGGDEIDRAGSAYIFQDPNLLGVVGNGALESSISIYPNPATELLNIESKTKTITDLKVFSITGALLQEVTDLQVSLYTLDISKFNEGVYFVTIGCGDGVTVQKKIIKVN
ncbi:T9SS type A sorting domain-containing protein [Aequorivita iocasae]|uniref:T9SS type A sorting domain-containing protein n=2 Tax=Flavobacteriaceae TaxID=49546 RepID=A0ABX7DVH6_9FLAO|nr:T9SS type A sorting domain-containing protein [Aequorivita iocasae]